MGAGGQVEYILGGAGGRGSYEDKRIDNISSNTGVGNSQFCA